MKHIWISVIRLISVNSQKIKPGRKTIIMVLHDLAQAMTLADFVCVMREGREEVLCYAPPQEVYEGGYLQKAFDVHCLKMEISQMFFIRWLQTAIIKIIILF